jgi:uncharacterized protein YggU (UPF0235/DUF167 family)
MVSARFDIRLKPRAKSDRVMVKEDGRLDIAVTSPPIDDRANEHLIELLSDCLDVSKYTITIIKGGHCRNKVAEVAALTKEEVLRRLKVAR